MAPRTTQPELTDMSVVLHVAFDLGATTWKMISGVPGSRARCKTVTAGDLDQVHAEITLAKRRFGLPADADVVSCYEAGRDGFWLHRHLISAGIANVVVDAASCEVDRRAKRRKTDRLDGENLLDLLIRYHGRGRSPLRVVNVPPVDIEDARRLHRERERLVKERTQHCSRIKDLLAKSGIRWNRLSTLPKQLDGLRGPADNAVPPHTKREILRECQRLELVREQVRAVEQERLELLNEPGCAATKLVGLLSSLRGVGLHSAAVLVYEFFLWRQFRNRREVGAAAGLVSAPWLSDSHAREQGISKAGNHRVRTLMVQLAWRWIRYQPQSSLTAWFHQRCGPPGGAAKRKRARKVTIVALARRLLIALWRFLERGEVPERACLKPAV